MTDRDVWPSYGFAYQGEYTLRDELAIAIETELDADLGIVVSAFKPSRLSPPHIYIEPDDPFFEYASNGALVWAYKAVIAVPGRHQAAYDWFETVGPYFVRAAASVSGARFHEMSAPDYIEEAEGRSYLTASAHITIKRNKE